jgi:hypothetical protein
MCGVHANCMQGTAGHRVVILRAAKLSTDRDVKKSLPTRARVQTRTACGHMLACCGLRAHGRTACVVCTRAQMVRPSSRPQSNHAHKLSLELKKQKQKKTLHTALRSVMLSGLAVRETAGESLNANNLSTRPNPSSHSNPRAARPQWCGLFFTA